MCNQVFLLSIQAFLGLRHPWSILFFFARPTDSPSRGGKAMANKKFYGDGLTTKLTCIVWTYGKCIFVITVFSRYKVHVK